MQVYESGVKFFIVVTKAKPPIRFSENLLGGYAIFQRI